MEKKVESAGRSRKRHDRNEQEVKNQPGAKGMSLVGMARVPDGSSKRCWWRESVGSNTRCWCGSKGSTVGNNHRSFAADAQCSRRALVATSEADEGPAVVGYASFSPRSTQLNSSRRGPKKNDADINPIPDEKNIPRQGRRVSSSSPIQPNGSPVQ
ncbi:uncharacterized protein MCYG_00919 [Microsporum canis CBS 113480]|uniref:Uncharacterized protein n=1 Tax=Arthroderma otae (strain ATCC MYA-4605 / CBS 113480) TaxID=554155 RepID=C5FDZ7_ARTOC|nr:uncharacterized protein MCYG_00919 [Microsporum canis CBS 113480]EEQ28031.1 predicted protein [Microsporum canis CBS 113480]